VTSESSARDARPFGWRVAAPLFIGYMALACAVQFWTGALPGGFGAHPDEGAHYVTGLMLRDFLLSGSYRSPMSFALGYYVHYPAVGLGHWPPGFYMLEGAWMMLFGSSRVGVLILEQALGALTSVLIARVARERLGWGLALWSGAIFLIFPATRSALGLTAPEMLMCALVVLAALAYGRFLTLPTVARGALFGVLASAAMLVKGNAFLLALLPPIMVLATRRWSLLKTVGFWTPLAIVLVLVAPWQLMTMRLGPQVLGGVGTSGGGDYGGGGGVAGAAIHAMPAAARQTLESLDIWALPIAALCAIVVIVRWKTFPTSWRVLMGVAVATVVFHIVIAAGVELRYLVTAMPAFALALGTVVAGLQRRVTVRSSASGRAVAVASCIACVVAFGISKTGWRNEGRFNPGGINKAARTVMRDIGSQRSAILVSSQNYKEVAFVAEIAMRDLPRPHHYVVRAYKAFANADWNGRRIEQTTRTEPDMVAYLDSVPIRYVVIDTATGLWPVPHHAMLRHLVETRPEWARQPLGGDSTGDTFLVFRRTGPLPSREPQVNVSVAGIRASGAAKPVTPEP
jgi:hypothetical protein